MTEQSIDEELEVLSSIYDDSFYSSVIGDRVIIQLSYHLSDSRSYTIEILFSSLMYPMDHSNIEIALKSSTYYIDSSFATSILNRISSENPSSNILFQLLEEIKEFLAVQEDNNPLHSQTMVDSIAAANNENLEDEAEVDPAVIHRRIAEREKKAKAATSSLSNGKIIRIIHGSNVVEQKSTFQAHIAEVTSMEEVEYVRSTLLLDKKVAAATHNIMAYRFTDPVTGIVHHDCDDDGECAAGGRLAEMVRLMGASNVIVVVSRWFGGVLLGPSRFKYICNTARDLMEEHGFCREDKKSKR